MRNQNGSTVIENLLAMAFLSMIFYMVISGSVQLFKIEGGTTRGVSEYQVVSHLMETIKSDPSVFRKNFAPASVVDETFLMDLPFVFRGSEFVEANSGLSTACDYVAASPGGTAPTNSGPNACDGRLGFIIRPLENYSGLYMVTIKVERAIKERVAVQDRPRTEDVFYRFVINSN